MNRHRKKEHVQPSFRAVGQTHAEWQAFEKPENTRQMYGRRFISLVDEIQFMLINNRHICIRIITLVSFNQEALFGDSNSVPEFLFCPYCKCIDRRGTCEDQRKKLMLFCCCIFQEVSEEVLQERRARWRAPEQTLPGLLRKYSKVVSSAHVGAITH